MNNYDRLDYLEHHGVSGQKWGVRKAPWYPIDAWKESLKNDKSDSNRNRIAKESTKQLNKIDKKSSFSKRYYKESMDEIDTLNKSNAKLKSKYSETDSTSKREKLKIKMDVNNERLKAAKAACNKHMKDIAINNKEVSDIKSYLKKNGYSIDEKAIKRSVNTKGEIAASIGFGLISAVTTGFVIVPTKTASGTKYKVKNNR